MKKRVLAGAILALFLTSGCGSAELSAIEVTSRDVATTRVASDEAPKYSRVIALANGAAEIIDSLGLKAIIIGRDIASTDESLQSIPVVTSGHQVVAEKIISLDPDLVIIDASVGPLQAIEALENAGIKVEMIQEVWKVEDISAKVLEIAAILEVSQSGDLLVQELDSRISDAAEKVSGSPRLAFLYLRGGNSIYLLGGKGSGADSLISSLGAVDVGAAKYSRAFSSLTSESIAETNPEIILVMIKGLASVGGVKGLVELPGVAQTLAGKNRKVIAVDDSLLLSFGPRTPDLLNALASAINEAQK